MRLPPLPPPPSCPSLPLIPVNERTTCLRRTGETAVSATKEAAGNPGHPRRLAFSRPVHAATGIGPERLGWGLVVALHHARLTVFKAAGPLAAVTRQRLWQPRPARERSWRETQSAKSRSSRPSRPSRQLVGLALLSLAAKKAAGRRRAAKGPTPRVKVPGIKRHWEALSFSV